ncbi:hypothetical protein K7432_007738 [Basidiobolus ranarum]|uniref:Uncharacterized protein n=1 Tax=Basidiobolus ranarum TaxID=34480 RepID=A0ABR2VZX3_9FUNG
MLDIADSEDGSLSISNLLKYLEIHLTYQQHQTPPNAKVKRRKLERETIASNTQAILINTWSLKSSSSLKQFVDVYETITSGTVVNSFENFVYVGAVKVALNLDKSEWDAQLANLNLSHETFKLPVTFLFTRKEGERESLFIYSVDHHTHAYLPLLEKHFTLETKKISTLTALFREATKGNHLKVQGFLEFDFITSSCELLFDIYLLNSLLSSEESVSIDFKEILKGLFCQNTTFTENELSDTSTLYSYLNTSNNLQYNGQVLNEELLNDLKVTLYPFQKRSIQWLLKREGIYSTTQKMEMIPVWWKRVHEEDGSSVDFQFNVLTGKITRDLSLEDQHTVRAPRGGILAEEMGLGKTIELIALHLLHRPNPQEIQAFNTVADSEKLLPSSATLIITPPTISQQWMSEIQTHAPSLRCVLFEKDNFSTEELSRYDVVVISFDILSKQLYYAQETKSRSRRFPSKYKYSPSPLVKILWWRVVIDEVQIVESLSSRAAEMVYHIPRINSWVVSGTPIKHSRNDLVVLLKFLKVEPFCYNVSQWKMLMAPENFEHFLALFGSIMQRTLKSQVESELSIPAQHTESVMLQFSDVEQYFYESLWNSCVNELVWSSTAEEKKSKMREWLYRLRQTCCHPQVCSRNRRILGGALRSIDEVLEFMFQHSRADVQSLERMYTTSKIKRAQILESDGKLEEARLLYHEILTTTQNQIDLLKKEISPVSTLLAIVPDETQLKATSQTDVRADQTPDTTHPDLRAEQEDLKNMKLWLHLWREIEHRLLFFLGSIYFKMENEAEETSYYELAEQSRVELLRPLSEGFQLELERFKRFRKSTEVNLAQPSPISSSAFTGGVLSRDLFERIESVTTALNAQNELLKSCHDIIVKMLISNLWDANDKDANGEEFQQSQLQQEEADVYQDVFMRIIRDRRQLVQGIVIGAGDSKLKTASDMTENLGKFRREYVRPLAHGNLKSYLAELKQISNKPMIQKEEVVIVEQEIRRLSKVVEELSNVIQLYEREIGMFRKLYNSRIEYYRQLQKISDDVTELQCYDHKKELEICKESEHKLQMEIVQSEGKLRYLRHLKETTGTEKQQEQERLCLICQMHFDTGMINPCGHIYCLECSKKWFGLHSKCPTCNTIVEKTQLNNVCFVPANIEHEENHTFNQMLLQRIKNINVDGGFGTKVDMLIRHIKYIHQCDQEADGPASKVIVFSQWDLVLNVIGLGLEKNGIRFVRLTGKDKNHTTMRFSNDNSIQVILLNAKSQSSGLTLVAANHVLFCEPLVNPGLELQAVNRVHRIGQTRETHVYWYILQNTIEEKIYERYQQKSKNFTENHLNNMSVSDIQRTLLDKKRTGFGEIVGDDDLKYFFESLGVDL